MTTRTAILAGVLIGMLVTLSVLIVHDTFALLNRRIDHIEEYLSSHPIPQLVIPQVEPSIPQSHKGELSQPQHWKV